MKIAQEKHALNLKFESFTLWQGGVMRRGCAVLAVLFALGLSAWTEDAPKAEIFTGYSFMSAAFPANPDPAAGGFRGSLNGWNGSAAFNVNRSLGVVADFGGYYGSPTKG